MMGFNCLNYNRIISGLVCIFVAIIFLPGQDGHSRGHNVLSYAYVGTEHGLDTLHQIGHNVGRSFGHGAHGIGHGGVIGVGDPFGSKHGLYGLSGIFTFNNKTILCGIKGGTCAAAASCVGKRFFVCDDSTTVCCLNTTFTGSLTIKKVIYPYGIPKKTKRKHKKKKTYQTHTHHSHHDYHSDDYSHGDYNYDHHDYHSDYHNDDHNNDHDNDHDSYDIHDYNSYDWKRK